MTRICNTDIKPLQSPVFTASIIEITGFLLQLSLLTYTIHNINKQGSTTSKKTVTKLCLLTQILGLIGIASTTFHSELEILFNLKLYDSPIYCQVFYSNFAVFISISYYASLIIFWLWRLKLVFSNTMWALSDFFYKVRSALSSSWAASLLLGVDRTVHCMLHMFLKSHQARGPQGYGCRDRPGNMIEKRAPSFGIPYSALAAQYSDPQTCTGNLGGILCFNSYHIEMIPKIWDI